MGVPEPQDLTAEQIRHLLTIGAEVWLWEGGLPKHKVYGVEGLTADHVTLGEDYKVVFKGAITGRMLGRQMSRTATIKAVVRTVARSGESNGSNAESTGDQIQSS